MLVEPDCQASTRQAGGELSVCPGKNYALVADAGRISLQHCRRQLEWTDCTMSRKQQLSVLRHVSAQARRRDNHDMLALVIDACRTHGHTLDSVLGSLIGTAADEEPAVALVLGGDQDTPNILSLPPEIVHLVSTSSTYCAGRIIRFGRPTFIYNNWFERDICGATEVKQGWAREKSYNGQESFIHSDSLQTFSDLASSGFKEAFRSPGKVVALRCDAPLQIMFRDGRGQGACTMRQWHLAQDDFHAMAFELHPLSQDEQRLITVYQETTRCQENMRGCQEITPGQESSHLRLAGGEVGAEQRERAEVGFFNAQQLGEEDLGAGEDSMVGLIALHPNTLQHPATRCNTLQRAATQCSTMLSIAT